MNSLHQRAFIRHPKIMWTISRCRFNRKGTSLDSGSSRSWPLSTHRLPDCSKLFWQQFSYIQTNHEALQRAVGRNLWVPEWYIPIYSGISEPPPSGDRLFPRRKRLDLHRQNLNGCAFLGNLYQVQPSRTQLCLFFEI